MLRLRRFFAWTVFYLALVSLIIFLTINSFWLYRLNLNFSTIPHQVGLSVGKIMTNYHQLLAYLELPWVHHLDMMDFPTSPNGLQHFIDVKHLFLLNNVILLVTIVPAVTFVVRLVRHQQGWMFIRTFQIAAVIPVLFGLIMLINFNGFFIAFHKILFRNSDWLFDPQFDPVINVLPESFFAQCFIMAFGLFECVMIFGIVFGKHQLKMSTQ